MDCIGPFVPDDLDLLAYADDDAGAPIQGHVAACPACQERVQALALEQRQLQRVLHRAGCPSSVELGEYHLGLLADHAVTAVAEHLKHCRACRTEIEDLATFMSRIRRPLAEATEDLFSSLRTIVAQLSPNPFAGFSPAFAPALRGPDGDSERAPTLYTAEDMLVTVDSWIERMGQPGRVVAGLIVGPVDFTDAEASIDDDATVSPSRINELGNFVFSDVPPGMHHLIIRLPATGIQIEIDELAVR